MYLEWLQAQNIRNLTNIVIEPDPQLNLFIGPNASGKTSLLEAICFLSRGRSFRTPRVKEVIQHHKKELLVTAGIRNARAYKHTTGIEKRHGRTQIKYNSEIIGKISEQAKNLPLILINPDSHNLVTGDPKQRRRWLDWAMFHVEPEYLDLWRSYHRSLRHRNTLIRKGNCVNSQLTGWEHSLGQKAVKITTRREQFIKEIQDAINTIYAQQKLTGAQIKYIQGWPSGQQLTETLEKNREGDLRCGYTRNGIHRADVEFIIAGHPMATTFSRGEIKQFITILLIAQGEVFEQRTAEKPIFLIDDFSSELDTGTKARVISLLKQQRSQVFLTATEQEPALQKDENTTLFHVKQGCILKAIE